MSYPRIKIGLNKLSAPVFNRGAATLERVEREFKSSQGTRSFPAFDPATFNQERSHQFPALITGYKRVDQIIPTGGGPLTAYNYYTYAFVPASIEIDLTNDPVPRVVQASTGFTSTISTPDPEDPKTNPPTLDSFGMGAWNIIELRNGSMVSDLDFSDPGFPGASIENVPVRGEVGDGVEHEWSVGFGVFVMMQRMRVRGMSPRPGAPLSSAAVQSDSDFGYFFEYPVSFQPSCD